MLSSLQRAANRLPARTRACVLLPAAARPAPALPASAVTLPTVVFAATLHTTTDRNSRVSPRAPVVLPDKAFEKSIFAKNRVASWLHHSGVYKHSNVTPKKPIPKRTERTRVHVVNEEFVDQIIKYLGSSLDRHKGCDLIDINPGVGVWSRALNDVLKPRKHILMEPDAEFYKPQLEPLLQRPNVELVQKHGIIWADLDPVLQSLPHQKRVPKTGPVERNDTLLVSMCLATSPKRKYHNYESLAGLVIHQMLTSVRVRSVFQSYGLVRLLLWVNDEDKRAFLPKSIYSRRRAALDSEVVMEWVHEVAGEDDLSKERREELVLKRQPVRERSMQVWSTQRALEKMKRDGRVCPPDRESEFVREVRQITPEMDAEDKKLIERIIHEVRERQKLVAEINANKPQDRGNEYDYDSKDPANYFLRKDLTTFRSKFFMRLPDNETGEVSKRKKLYGVALWRARHVPAEKGATGEENEGEEEEEEGEEEEEEDNIMEERDEFEEAEEMEEVEVKPKRRARRKKTEAEVHLEEDAEESHQEASNEAPAAEEKPTRRRRSRTKAVDAEGEVQAPDGTAGEEPATTGGEEGEKQKKRRRRTKAEMEAARATAAAEKALRDAAREKRAASREANGPVDDDDIQDFDDDSYYEATRRTPWAAPDCDRIKPHRHPGSLAAATKRALGENDPRSGSVREVRDLLARAFVTEWRRLRTEYQQGRITLDEYMREHAILNDDIRVSHINYIASTRMQSDDEHAAMQEPPVLLWDRREYEPMTVRQGDFYPDVPCALLDLQPKEMKPLLRDNVDQASVVFDVLAMSLVNTSSDVESMLNRVWPGAADGCMVNMPELVNLKRYGTPAEIKGLSITTMTGRRMNEEQYMELLEAWYKWPFRPSFQDLICHHTEEPPADMQVEGSVVGHKHIDITAV
ncbi:hypothetical protein TD95_000744 [Thielaviopsis punctulata]|uniref:rRNA adenine N(6)-methyltransferase n=1 Tax=Thielaviopsis punctulata TaxID=72032 RepID=A0A0F4ZJR6_9PEZI|nr:hypothetical protein TD95_000744 [Thielaviopsis punctulata]